MGTNIRSELSPKGDRKLREIELALYGVAEIGRVRRTDAIETAILAADPAECVRVWREAQGTTAPAQPEEVPVH